MINASKRTISFVLIGLVIILLVSFAKSHTNIGRKNEKAQLELKEVSDITIKAESADILVKATDRSDILIESRKAKGIETEMAENEVFISQKKSIFGGGFLYIELPKDKTKSLSLTNSTGDVDVAGIEAESIFISLTTGDVNLLSSSSDLISLSLVSGDVNVDDTASPKQSYCLTTGDLSLSCCDADTIEVSILTGDFESYGTFFNTATIDIATGDVDIQSEKEDIAVQYNKDGLGGSVEIFGKEHSQKESSSRNLVVNQKIGDLRVYK